MDNKENIPYQSNHNSASFFHKLKGSAKRASELSNPFEVVTDMPPWRSSVHNSDNDLSSLRHNSDCNFSSENDD